MTPPHVSADSPSPVATPRQALRPRASPDSSDHSYDRSAMSWHTDDTAWLHASTANAPHIFDIDHSFSGLLYTVPAGYVNADEYSLSSHHSPSEPPLQRSGSAQSTPVPSHHSAHSSNPFTPRSSRHSSEASRSEYAFDSPPYPSTWDHEDESPDNWTDPDPQTPSPHFLELVQSPVNPDGDGRGVGLHGRHGRHGRYPHGRQPRTTRTGRHAVERRLVRLVLSPRRPVVRDPLARVAHHHPREPRGPQVEPHGPPLVHPQFRVGQLVPCGPVGL